MQIFSRKNFNDLSKSQIRIHTQIKLLKKQKRREELQYTRTSSKQRITIPDETIVQKGKQNTFFTQNKHPAGYSNDNRDTFKTNQHDGAEIGANNSNKKRNKTKNNKDCSFKNPPRNRYQSRNKEVKKKNRLCDKYKNRSTH